MPAPAATPTPTNRKTKNHHAESGKKSPPKIRLACGEPKIAQEYAPTAKKAT